MRRLVCLIFAAALVASCSSSNGTASDTSGASSVSTIAPATDPAPVTSDVVAQPSTTAVTENTASESSIAPPTTSGPDVTSDRPYDVFVPSTYEASTAMPLVVLLHGFGATGAIQEAYFQLQPLAESRGFLYVHPDGTVNAISKQFWNATNACCGFGAEVDDVAYLTALVQEVQREYNVDPQRIYFVGHSNGGFMSYRMACDRADMVAAIVSLAGATWDDNTKCNPSEPVSVLQIHGTADATIGFEGGTLLGNDHPGARETVADWAANNECSGPATDLPTPLDLEANIAGDESTATQYSGCPIGGAVELWTIPGASHIPAVPSTFGADVIDFLLAHPKP